MGTDEIALDKSNEIFATWKNSSSITAPSRSWGSDHGASLHGISQWWLNLKMIPSTGPSVPWGEDRSGGSSKFCQLKNEYKIVP